MTTNKPEAVVYATTLYSNEVVAALMRRTGERHEPVVRLADYEALQAECDRLRKRARTAEREYSKVARTLKGLERVAQGVSDNSDEVCGENNQLRAECAELRKDAERLDWIVSEGAIVAHAGVRGEPHRYRVEWPLLGEIGINWFTSERAAIDAAMQADTPC